MRSNRLFRYGILSTIIVWLGLLAFIPFLLVLVTSFLSNGTQHLIDLDVTLDNYRALIQPIYCRILWQSVKLAVAVSTICLMIGYPAAFFISQLAGRYKTLALLLVILPFWVSSLIRTYAILALLKTKGLINAVLLGLGIIHQPLQMLYTNVAVLVGCVYDLLPFMVLPLYTSIEKIDRRLLEAARDLGAGRVRLFARIVLPLTLPGIIAGTLLVFLPTMTLFYIPVLLGGAKSMLMGNLIENQFLVMHNWPGGAATSVVLTLLMLLLLVFYRRYAKGKKTQEMLV